MFSVASLRVHLRSYRYYLPFVQRTFDVFKELPHAAGLAGARALVDRDRTFWVASLWEDERSMGRFYESGAHARAVPMVAKWCDEAAVVSWQTPDRVVPGFAECHRRLLAEARLTKIDHPSARHLARDISPPGKEYWFNARTLTRPASGR